MKSFLLSVAVSVVLTTYAPSAGADSTFVRADSNSDGALDIADALFTIGYVFLGGPAPSCRDAADANDDGSLDIADPIATLNALFHQNFPIPQPYPSCGADLVSDALTCDSYSICPGAFAEIRADGALAAVTDPSSDLYGVRVQIPPGACTEGSVVAVERIADPPPFSERSLPMGECIRLDLPHMLDGHSADLCLPYNDTDDNGTVDGTEAPESAVLVQVYDPGLERWENTAEVAVDTQANNACVKVNSPGLFHASLVFISPDTGPSLRILTYNTALTQMPMPQFDGTHPVSGKQISDTFRARLIANGILRVNPDVVGLNEVFDADGRDELHKRLRWVYPHHVLYLDSEHCDVCIESGLMLFSKFPFVELSDHTYEAQDCTAYNGKGVNWDNQVAFADFEHDCEGDDCKANKGAGLVRIRNPHTNQKFTVVFTHLQASYGSDDEGDASVQLTARRNQMLRIYSLIRGTLTDAQMLSEPTYLFGDLNINGNLWSVENYQLPPLHGEWEYFFHELNYGGLGAPHFFACGNQMCPHSLDRSSLADSWHYMTSPDDLGRTSGCDFVFYDDPPHEKKSGERLDYILHNSPHGITRPQHLSIAWNVGDNSGTHQYSDHLPVLADFSRCGPHCMATTAREVPTLKSGETDVYDGNIWYQGGMQWHIIRKAGCYAIRAHSGNPPRARLDVYEKHDLSRPYEPHPGEVSLHYGPKYAMPDPPYYIRISGQKWNEGHATTDRSWTGPYKIIIHMLDCASADESCPLLPGVEPQDFKWSSNPLNDDDTAWYTFMTDVGERGDYPTLKFLLSLPSGMQTPDYQSAKFAFEIATTESDNPAMQPQPFTGFGTEDEGGTIYADATDLDAAGDEPKEYYLRIQRKQSPAEETIKVGYQTNLTYFHPRAMVCRTQDDNFGDDDVYYYIEVDTEKGERCTCVDLDACPACKWSYLGEYDNGTSLIPKKLADRERKFVRWIVFNLMEYDSADPNDYLNRHPDYGHRILPLAEDKATAGKTYKWASQVGGDVYEYLYELKYDLSHRPRNAGAPH